MCTSGCDCPESFLSCCILLYEQTVVHVHLKSKLNHYIFTTSIHVGTAMDKSQLKSYAVWNCLFRANIVY